MNREELYKRYINELKIYNPNLIVLKTEDIFKQYYEIQSFSDLIWVDIYDGMNIIGFVLITTGSHCPKYVDYHIMECYILPEYRKQNRMTKTLLDFITKNTGTYCLFVLMQNNIALSFWKHFIDTYTNSIPAQNNVPFGTTCVELAFQTKGKTS